MFYALRDRVRRSRFARACAGVLHAAPVTLDGTSRLAVLTQLQHKDVLMFLLAIKSFARHVAPGAVFVVDDGSLTDGDRATLAAQVPGLTLFGLEQFRVPACPRGGTWERLLAIAALVGDYYVIQLDSDTLTIGPIDDVRQCIARGTSFAIGTWDRQSLESMQERCATAKGRVAQGDAHIQVVAEAHFDRLVDFRTLRYVRGCSGFAGFAPRSFSRAFVETISSQMWAALGDRWSEWGSEQVMSNVVVANVSDAMVLPHPKYADCHKMRAGLTEFVHFIGSCRFDDGNYARLGAQVIATL
jgi:hypothetical protein